MNVVYSNVLLIDMGYICRIIDGRISSKITKLSIAVLNLYEHTSFSNNFCNATSVCCNYRHVRVRVYVSPHVLQEKNVNMKTDGYAEVNHTPVLHTHTHMHARTQVTLVIQPQSVYRDLDFTG